MAMKKNIYQSCKSFKLMGSSQDYISLEQLNHVVSNIIETFKDCENEVRISWCESEWSGKVEFIVSEFRMETDEEYQARIEKEQQLKLNQLRQLLEIVNDLDYESAVEANRIISDRMMEFNNAS
jgi:hypothetical protein